MSRSLGEFLLRSNRASSSPMSRENSFGVGMEVGAQVESSEEKAIVDSMGEGDPSIFR